MFACSVEENYDRRLSSLLESRFSGTVRQVVRYGLCSSGGTSRRNRSQPTCPPRRTQCWRGESPSCISETHNFPNSIQLVVNIESPMICTLFGNPVLRVHFSSFSLCTTACFLFCVSSSPFSPHSATSGIMASFLAKNNFVPTTGNFEERFLLGRSNHQHSSPVHFTRMLSQGLCVCASSSECFVGQ